MRGLQPPSLAQLCDLRTAGDWQRYTDAVTRAGRDRAVVRRAAADLDHLEIQTWNLESTAICCGLDPLADPEVSAAWDGLDLARRVFFDVVRRRGLDAYQRASERVYSSRWPTVTLASWSDAHNKMVAARDRYEVILELPRELHTAREQAEAAAAYEHTEGIFSLVDLERRKQQTQRQADFKAGIVRTHVPHRKRVRYL